MIDEEEDKKNTLNGIKKANFFNNITLCLFIGSIMTLAVLFIQFDSDIEEDMKIELL